MAKARPTKAGTDAFKKVTLLIPLKYNDGTMIPQQELVRIKRELFVAFGGWTDEGVVQGAYRMQATGKKKVEQHVKLSVVLKEHEIPDLRQMTQVWCAVLEQECLLMEITASIVEFVTPPTGEV